MDYTTQFRLSFLSENPHLDIHMGDCITTGHGTHKYICTYSGDWSVEDLVNYLDGGIYNYGGRIENEIKNEDGSTTATVCVYYD